ncbi:hypothetical protein BC938DRAFT_482256 [Jimgerdemannia flammicorona]|uniref:Uncharacterized protein n=1 Tax=Jimgerdemannia flammicorona TaxID=994334 RepID=A0A433R0C2_9FUNG|nr:hypothetical protein BC938DRAFT_482256 [Jimgerdemannia flammicorona]
MMLLIYRFRQFHFLPKRWRQLLGESFRSPQCLLSRLRTGANLAPVDEDLIRIYIFWPSFHNKLR